MGQSPESSTYNDNGDGLPFFQGNADFGEMHPVTRIWCKIPTRVAQAGDILISVRAPIGAMNYASEECCIGRGLAAITPNSSKISSEYIYWLLKSKNKELNSKGTGSTFKAIGKKVLEELQVPDICLKKQEEYVAVLRSVYEVVKIRRSQIQNLDNLIKARFVEMFGNVNSNEHGWRRGKFAEISTKITDGEHGTVPRVNSDDGYLYFMARNINRKGIIDLTEASYVSPEIHSKIYKRCNPEPDDLLLVCVGATIGKCALVPNDLGPFSMARSVALIKPDREQIVSSFLLHLLRSEDIQKSIAQCSHAAAQAGLYTNMIANLDALIPPLDLQKRFDIFAKQVDKSKVVVQKALDKAQQLFDSLMQEYFG